MAASKKSAPADKKASLLRALMLEYAQTNPPANVPVARTPAKGFAPGNRETSLSPTQTRARI